MDANNFKSINAGEQRFEYALWTKVFMELVFVPVALLTLML